MDPKLRRQRALEAEQLVVDHLKAHGFQIVARNLRQGALEIDIVARAGDLIALVEVRGRGKTARTSPFGSVSPTKRQRLRRAAKLLWRARYARDPSVTRLRFDVASVIFSDAGTRVDYAVAAFT
ncbi:MAG TPA: YraN family protein [Polyangiaceae bacterium]|nr:YraN family protein [Polyangiaceae bacterium]